LSDEWLSHGRTFDTTMMFDWRTFVHWNV